MSNLQIEGLTLTKAGEEAVEVIHSLFPDLDDRGILDVLLGIVQKEPTLDYVRIDRGGPSVLVGCHCKSCNLTRFMTSGWVGHIKWIETGLCSHCRMIEEGK